VWLPSFSSPLTGNPFPTNLFIFLLPDPPHSIEIRSISSKENRDCRPSCGCQLGAGDGGPCGECSTDRGGKHRYLSIQPLRKRARQVSLRPDSACCCARAVPGHRRLSRLAYRKPAGRSKGLTTNEHVDAQRTLNVGESVAMATI
jgi:hypothetical protein